VAGAKQAEADRLAAAKELEAQWTSGAAILCNRGAAAGTAGCAACLKASSGFARVGAIRAACCATIIELPYLAGARRVFIGSRCAFSAHTASMAARIFDSGMVPRSVG